MIAGTLVAAVSCWSLFVAAVQHGSNPGSVQLDGHLVRQYRTAANTDSGEYCCSGQSSSTAADDITNSAEIPLNVIMELNQVTNVSELFTKFMPDTNMDDAQRRISTTGFQSRTSPNLERKAVFMPKPASCSIGNQTISLKDTDDRSLYYFPTCTRVERCGGCCGHDLMACQPTKTETIHYEVVVSQFNGEGKLEFKGRKTVSTERHLKCRCQCILKRENCSPLQTYNPKDCLCTCSNKDDEEKCHNEHDLKQWNSDTCACECRKIEECTSGFKFDEYSCRCEPFRKRTRGNRNRHNI